MGHQATILIKIKGLSKKQLQMGWYTLHQMEWLMILKEGSGRPLMHVVTTEAMAKMTALT
jgi:hypothetical protein